jgi:hypothetical protein
MIYKSKASNLGPKGHLTRRVFAAILRRIWALPLPAG